MDVGGVAESLRGEARAVNERRLLVLAGERDATEAAARTALAAADVTDAVLVGGRDALDCERVRPKHADRLLGTTREAVLLDCHDTTRPNALGRAVGAVDGGGLLVLLTPPLGEWPDRRGGFDRSLAVPPFEVGDVTGRFRARLVALLCEHPGVAVLDVDRGAVERDGHTDPAPRLPRDPPAVPADRSFPADAYEACRTADQVDAVRALEALRDARAGVVVEADRGRGKSSAAGLAAACLAAEGADVLVTAPGHANAAELFVRAAELLGALDARAATEGDPPRRLDTGEGSVAFAPPPEAAERAAAPAVDVLLVDEAAALPVRLLEATLAADRVAYLTTVHGYEGAGRGFAVRFRDRLAADRDVVDVTLADPIRYAAGDPVEAWAFRALLLDARPPVDPLVADATPATVTYEPLPGDHLVEDEHLLREAFGTLVAAHYRTEPNDLARLLDAPNVAVRALTHDGHVAAVALLAREGGLPEDWQARMYEGERVPGNMLPDVLTTQLRDPDAAALVGYRVLRIATHPARRSRGLGSHLLAAVRDEFADVDWLGVGYGATPDLLRFWAANGYRTLSLSTTRNDTSGEYSAVMLDPVSDAGRRLAREHGDWFLARLPGVLSDPLDDLDPDVARAALAAARDPPVPDLDDRAWRVVAGAAHGPGLYDVDPRPFRRLAVAALAREDVDLDARDERLLVRKVLQGEDWRTVADALGYHSRGECMRALGAAYQPIVDAYGPASARAERDRYE